VPQKGCDTSIIEDGINQLSGEKVVIIKSTVIPGTTERLQKKFSQHKIIFNPEFLTEETTDGDMAYPDKQIVGYTQKSYNVAKNVLQQLPLAPYESIVPSHVAEMIKYANNTWFAVKVAMNNELYDLAKKIGFSEDDWFKIINGLEADKRVGRTHLAIVHKDKRGYWGKCLPKDIKALLDFAKEHGVDMPIRKATNDYNDKLLRSQGINEYI
jgi:UDPglucose 6-dehydrogenase